MGKQGAIVKKLLFHFADFLLFISIDHASISWALSYKVLKRLTVPLEINYLAHA